MHPRNTYGDARPDFVSLARRHAGFSVASNGGRRVDFRNEEFLRQLTCALLKVDFGLHVELPHGRLVPAVPQRLNYLHWVEDLVAGGAAEVPKGSSVLGIDVGTGASAIFSLLAAKTNGWSILATDIDDTSLSFAAENVTRNNLQGLVSVLKVSDDEYLAGPMSRSDFRDASLAFCMCNPPFFGSEDEACAASSREQRPQPSSAWTGAGTEMITDGGEVAFVGHLVQDSVALRGRVKWYTSMLGKKSSVAALQRILTQHQVPRVVTTEFTQGKTRRWGIAWSFDAGATVPATSAQGTKKSRKRKRPLEFVIPAPTPLAGDVTNTQTAVCCKLESLLSELEIEFSASTAVDTVACYQCTAQSDTWSHSRRRRRKAEHGGRQSQASQEHRDTPEITPPQPSAAVSTGMEDAALATPTASNDPECALATASGQMLSRTRATSSEKCPMGAERSETVDGETDGSHCASQTGAVNDATVDCTHAPVTGSLARHDARLPPALQFSVTASCCSDGDTTVELDCDAQYSREVLHQVCLLLKKQMTGSFGSRADTPAQK